MSEQAQTELSCGERARGGPWYPLRQWWPSGRLSNQDVGLPPFLEPAEPRWMSVDWLQRSWAAAPLFVPHVAGPARRPGLLGEEPCTWRVGLDVAHFSPSEVSLSVGGGFLQVAGRHDERPDEHGFIARCFTRKYRLPEEIDATQITATLSADGILTVEAPVPETSLPAASVITMKVEMEAPGEPEEEGEKAECEKAEGDKAEGPEKDEDSCRAPEAPEFLPAEDHGAEEESPAEVGGDQQAHPGSATAGREQEEEEEAHGQPAEEEEAHGQPAEEEKAHGQPAEEEEEVHGQPAEEEEEAHGQPAEEEEEEAHGQPAEEEEEAHGQPAEEAAPPAPADAKGAESVQVPPEQREAPGGQESPDTDTSGEPEHKEPAVGGEIQAMAGSVEAAEEIALPEETEPELGNSPPSEGLSQEPGAPAMKQEDTE